MSSTDKPPLPSPSKETQKSLLSYLSTWGKSPLPPTLLATLITSLHIRPFQFLPMLFPPVLLFSTYLNLQNFPVDSAGLTAAWSGLYLVMASRRKLGLGGLRGLGTRFGARGMVRGAAMGTAAGNVLSCGMVYAFGKREKGGEEEVV